MSFLILHSLYYLLLYSSRRHHFSCPPSLLTKFLHVKLQLLSFFSFFSFFLRFDMVVVHVQLQLQLLLLFSSVALSLRIMIALARNNIAPVFHFFLSPFRLWNSFICCQSSLFLFHSSFFLVFSLSLSLYFAWMVQINLPHFKEPSSFSTASSLWVLLTHVSAAAVIAATVLGGGGGEGKRMLTTAKTMLTTWNNFSAIFFCEVFFSFCFQKVVLPLD